MWGPWFMETLIFPLSLAVTLKSIFKLKKKKKQSIAGFPGVPPGPGFLRALPPVFN
jgi:hypothetical protein